MPLVATVPGSPHEASYQRSSNPPEFAQPRLELADLRESEAGGGSRTRHEASESKGSHGILGLKGGLFEALRGNVSRLSGV